MLPLWSMRPGAWVNFYPFTGIRLAWSMLVAAVALSVFSCRKDRREQSYSYVYVQSADGELNPMDGVGGSWDRNAGIGQISGEGSACERIQIYLPALHDTGDYPGTGKHNIHYSDGASFDANRFESGTIHLSRVDNSCIVGEFEVYLTDTQDGVETRPVFGNFRITAQ